MFDVDALGNQRANSNNNQPNDKIATRTTQSIYDVTINVQIMFGIMLSIKLLGVRTIRLLSSLNNTNRGGSVP